MAKGRERPHADQVRAAVEAGAAARSAVAASWRRSMALYGLDPENRRPPRTLSGAELRVARERLEPLIQLARPSLDRLFKAVGGVGCCVLLTDSAGVPVERRGVPADDAQFRDWGLWIGAVWSEESEGTNGIGTCLAEARPLTIHRDQHFHTRNGDLSCTTVPIFDHEGRLAAALDVSSCRADRTEAVTGLIAAAAADAARRIEERGLRQAFPHARIVLADDGAAGALLAIDADDLIVGATRAARHFLGITPERLRQALPAADILGASPGVAGLLQAERGAVQRALARAGGNVSAAARALDATSEARMTARAFSLDPILQDDPSRKEETK